MSAPAPDRRLPRKCGVILTCFDNGRKRFKAVSVEDAVVAPEAAVETPPEPIAPALAAIPPIPGAATE